MAQFRRVLNSNLMNLFFLNNAMNSQPILIIKFVETDRRVPFLLVLGRPGSVLVLTSGVLQTSL